METIFDKSLQTLIYNRKLKKGSGSSIYGLEVAKAMDLDNEFIEQAETIRKKLMNKNNLIVNNKTSRYNSEIVLDNCAICNCKTEEIHHINEQCLADNKGMIDYFHKNNLFNLVQLCHKCHYDVTYGKLFINGYLDTSMGVKLQYKYKSEKEAQFIKKKKKYSQDQIEIIKDIYEKTKKYSITKKTLDTKHKIQISQPTLKKIVENNY